MKLSREARILFAFVAVAAAAWIWVNFFSQSTPTLSAETPTDALTPEVAENGADIVADTDAADTSETEAGTLQTSPNTATDAEATAAAPEGTESATTDGTEVAAETTDENSASEAEAEAGEDADTVLAGSEGTDSTETDAVGGTDEAETVAQTDEEGAETGSSETAPETAGTETTATEAPAAGERPSVVQAQPVAARDIEVAELPFLVTEPPALEEEAPTEEAGLELSRPRGGLRVSVNPFSPLVLQAAPAAETVVVATPPPATTPGPGIVTVPIPNEPTRLGTTANLPAAPGGAAGVGPGIGADLDSLTTPIPRPLTPQPTQANSLPRPLPGGTLSSTPDILRSTRSAPAAPTNPLAGANLGEVAALRLPGQGGAAVTFENVSPPALEGTASAEQIPLPVGNRRPAPQTAQSDPLVAGASDLSRFLRDNNFQFTGSVVGPIGVGVFRSSLTATPITLVLGQALQDTDIVLTSLKGKQAEFTQDDEKQVLTLDLR